MSGHLDRDHIASEIRDFVVTDLDGEDGLIGAPDQPVASIRMGADWVDVFVRMAPLG